MRSKYPSLHSSLDLTARKQWAIICCIRFCGQSREGFWLSSVGPAPHFLLYLHLHCNLTHTCTSQLYFHLHNHASLHLHMLRVTSRDSFNKLTELLLCDRH
jgi:hypothetical protein